ncbi:MAG: hypothetical protein J6V09_00110 [Clostridia bacterium]|nr:hypothetical protein [Clostridia bacterium]
MYCVKCGVELADSEKKCPLCETPVYYPERVLSDEAPYPEFVHPEDKISRRGFYFIISMLFCMGAIIPTVCDISLNHGLTWSGYTIGALLLAYVIFVLPKWFYRPSPAIFAPVDFLAIGLYALYIDIATSGGWFLPFAFPVLGAFALIVCAVVILSYYLRAGYLYIFGGGFILLGGFTLFVELLIHKNFAIRHPHMWSIYPLSTMALIGIMLIVIAIVRPFREYLRKIFAI